MQGFHNPLAAVLSVSLPPEVVPCVSSDNVAAREPTWYPRDVIAPLTSVDRSSTLDFEWCPFCAFTTTSSEALQLHLPTHFRAAATSAPTYRQALVAAQAAVWPSAVPLASIAKCLRRSYLADAALLRAPDSTCAVCGLILRDTCSRRFSFSHEGLQQWHALFSARAFLDSVRADYTHMLDTFIGLSWELLLPSCASVPSDCLRLLDAAAADSLHPPYVAVTDRFIALLKTCCIVMCFRIRPGKLCKSATLTAHMDEILASTLPLLLSNHIPARWEFFDIVCASQLPMIVLIAAPCPPVCNIVAVRRC